MIDEEENDHQTHIEENFEDKNSSRDQLPNDYRLGPFQDKLGEEFFDGDPMDPQRKHHLHLNKNTRNL
jgi:hypothetical protein